jgi:hypothetical protein
MFEKLSDSHANITEQWLIELRAAYQQYQTDRR